MIRALLIDDEPRVLSGLLHSIDWQACGLDAVDTCRDAPEALDAILSGAYDLVVTDIRMPKLLGTDIILKSKESGIRCEFIVTSGYSDFSFLQTALRAQACDYLLKPVDPDELRAAVSKAVENIKREGFLYRYRAERWINEDMDLSLLLRGKGVSLDSLCCVSMQKDEETVVSALRMTKIEHTHIVLSNEQLCVSVYVAGRDELEALGHSKLPFAMGMSSVGHVKELLNLVEQASVAYHETEFFQRSVCTHYTGKRGPIGLAEGMELLRLKDFEPGAALKKLDQVAACAASDEWTLMDAMYLCNCVLTASTSVDANGQFLFGEEELLNNYSSFAQLCEHLRSALRDPASRKAELKAGDESHRMEHIVGQIVAYIDENYQAPLTLRDLSQTFHVGMAYLSTMFKRSTGTGFSDYVSKKRIEAACSLLLNTDLPLLDIALRCGYSDCFYFMRIFRKYTASTPTQFRKSAGREGS